MQDLNQIRHIAARNLTPRQQEMFAHLVLKSLGAVNRSGHEMFGWCTSGDLAQDRYELAQVLFKHPV